MAKPINVDELRELRENDIPHALIDVREKGDFVQQHIFKAVPIPRGLLEVRLPPRVPDTSVPLIFYDEDRLRAPQAAETAEALGYEDVRILSGGLAAWRDAGHRADYGTNVPGKDYGEKVAVQRKTPHLTPDEIVERQQRGEKLVILDSRTREEYDRAHVPGAYSVPGGELPAQVATLLQDGEHKDATLVVNCAGRTRSILGADVLIRMGLPNPVYALENGTMAWSMAGYELERDTGRILNEIGEPATSAELKQFADRVANEDKVRSLSLDQLDDLIANEGIVYLVDVRMPEEYLESHIPGAVSIPAGQIALAADEILAVNQAPIVMLSNAGVRAKVAGSIARQIGYPHVFSLDEGIESWRLAGRDLDSGELQFEVSGLDDARNLTQSISTSDLKSMLDDQKPVQIVDVKGSGDYALSHIAGSTWIPRGDLERRIDEVATDKDSAIVLTCNDGVRSAFAASTLQDLGYSNVKWLEGGLDTWEAAGHETVEGLDGADVSLRVAKDDVEMIGRVGPLARSRQDMIDYLEWEIALGDKYED